MTDHEFLRRHPKVKASQLAQFRLRAFYTMHRCIEKQNPGMRNDMLFVQALVASVEPIVNEELAARAMRKMNPEDINALLAEIVPERVRAWSDRAAAQRGGGE